MIRKALILSLLAAPLTAEDSFDRQAVLEVVESLSRQHQSLVDEIDNLRKLLGVMPALDGLQPLKPAPKMKERLRVRLEDGISSFETGDYDRAKEDFQRAWEEAPEHATTNYNLGLAYHKLGNVVLAKKMLKTAIERDKAIAGVEKIREYLQGKNKDEADDDLTAEEREQQTVVINLKKEADSYLRSRTIPLPKRRAETVRLLREITEKAQDSRALQRKYLLDVADSYAHFELYEQAEQTLNLYEKAMKGEVLPDGFHAKRLDLEEKQEALKELLSSYLGNKPDKKVRRQLKRNIEELEIFASQMSEFVSDFEEGDQDFDKIAKRLGEFRWGGKPNRHVIVANRFEEMLYSSLDGGLALDRYQDVKGQKFLQHITRLADRMHLKQVEMKEVQLTVGNKTVPYIVLYTYIPKHESFIIVRIPRSDFEQT